MRSAEADMRPFAGAPYAPSNTFITTGRMESSLRTYTSLTSYPTEKLVVEPKAPHPAAKTMSLAQLLASR